MPGVGDTEPVMRECLPTQKFFLTILDSDDIRL